MWGVKSTGLPRHTGLVRLFLLFFFAVLLFYEFRRAGIFEDFFFALLFGFFLRLRLGFPVFGYNNKT